MIDEQLGELNLVVEYIAYADDLLISVEGSARSEFEQMGTEYMQMVSAWSEKVWGSTEQTVIMMPNSYLCHRSPNKLNEMYLN